MDNFLAFIFRQKKLAFFITITVLIAGVYDLSSIKREKFPNIKIDTVMINTSFPNASSSDVELLVTDKIEKKINGISGIKDYSSTSSEGFSMVSVNIDPDVKDKQEVIDEITEAVGNIRDFPYEVEDLPIISELQTSNMPILDINIVDNINNYEKVNALVNSLSKDLLLVKGVSEVALDSSGIQREVKILLDSQKLSRYSIGIQTVINKIKTRNIRYSAGDNNDFDNTKKIVVISDLADLEKLGNIIIKSTFDGPIILLKDIADIKLDFTKAKTIYRVNGKQGFRLSIFKKDSADIIRTVKRVRTKVNSIKKQYQKSIGIFYSRDNSKEVDNRLNIIINNSFIGLMIILVVLGMFLSIKLSFWVALSIPVCLLGTTLFLSYIDSSLNLLSLMGMILVLGIVVDDSIVLAESIYRYRAIDNSIQSTIMGFKRVIVPVIATIISTIVVFSSMFFISGVNGKFIFILPIIVIVALAISFLEATCILPTHIQGSKIKVKNKKTMFYYVENCFEKISYYVLSARYFIVILFIGILVVGFFTLSKLNYNFFPQEGSNSIRGRIVMPSGSSLDKKQKISNEFEKMVMEQLGDDLLYISSEIKDSDVKLTIRLTERTKTNKSVFAILNTLSEKKNNVIEKLGYKADRNKSLENISVKFSVVTPGPRSADADLTISMKSTNEIQLKKAAKSFENILNNIDGVTDVNLDNKIKNGRLLVKLDYEKINRLNIDLNAINDYLKLVYSGIKLFEKKKNSEDLNYVLYIDSENNNEQYINSLKITNKQGKLIPFNTFATLIKVAGEPDYNHYNGERSIKVNVSVDQTKININILEKIALEKLNLSKNFPEVNNFKINENNVLGDFTKAVTFSLIIIIAILAVLFNSYSQPFLVLIIIPFAFIGIIFAFYLHQEMLSFMALLGGLSLIGIVVNDSLVLIYHLNYLKKQNKDKTDIVSVKNWVSKGVKERFRAVILTTATTVASVLPMAYGLGGYDFVLRPIALALGWGLLFATLVTLVLLPSLYIIHHQIMFFFKRLGNFFKKKNKQILKVQ